MKKLFLIAFLGSSIVAIAQTPGAIHFKKGQKLEIVTETKKATSMDFMGQSMENKVNSTVTESYDVENMTDNAATIEYKVKRVLVTAEGMGRTESFDSEKEGDRKGELGKMLEKGLKNKYTMEVDKSGNIIAVKADDDNPHAKRTPEEEAVSEMLAMQFGLNFGLPKTGSSSIFKLLPGKALTTGETWTENTDVNGVKKTANYKVASITDEDIIIDFTEESTINTKQDMMGAEAIITGNEKSNGRITLDKSTGIFKSKTFTKESKANIEAQGMSIPTTDKTTVTVTVKG
ncbi:MAG: hypothetical protein H0U44_12595 [Flavisolibacter sp.]|jgi:hypothetical protein|nr:hypothetical protein [Flavisolibacter sp.]